VASDGAALIPTMVKINRDDNSMPTTGLRGSLAALPPMTTNYDNVVDNFAVEFHSRTVIPYFEADKNTRWGCSPARVLSTKPMWMGKVLRFADLPEIKADSLIVAVQRSAHCQQTKGFSVVLQPCHL